MADRTNVLMRLAQANESGEAIGQIQTLSGEVIIVRADGTEVKGGQGAEIFQGDVVRTADGGEVGMVFADNTTFSLGSDAEMIIDEVFSELFLLYAFCGESPRIKRNAHMRAITEGGA